MSLTTTVARGVRSATYNPEAEKAFEEDRKLANQSKQKIREGTTKAQNDLTTLASRENTPAASVKEIQTLIDGMKKYVTDNPEATSVDLEDKYQQFTEALQNAVGKLVLLQSISATLLFYEAVLKDAESRKQLASDKKGPLEAKLKDGKKIVEMGSTKTGNEIRIAFETWNKEFVPLLQAAGINAQPKKDPKQLEQEAKEKEQQTKEREEAEKKKFSFSRFAKSVSSTASTVISSLLYVMLCLVMGMLAANDAIGREPAYRVLYFIYGAIFAPFLLLHYFYRWYKGTSPKIYTLLPYTQSQAETSIGRFFLFPFYYQEDKVARDLMVDFMKQSAEAVGKTFDPATLGTIGNHAEKALENMKKMTADAGQAAATATKAILPNVSTLRVNSA